MKKWIDLFDLFNEFIIDYFILLKKRKADSYLLSKRAKREEKEKLTIEY